MADAEARTSGVEGLDHERLSDDRGVVTVTRVVTPVPMATRSVACPIAPSIVHALPDPPVPPRLVVVAQAKAVEAGLLGGDRRFDDACGDCLLDYAGAAKLLGCRAGSSDDVGQRAPRLGR